MQNGKLVVTQGDIQNVKGEYKTLLSALKYW
jgi:hypothetical protein